MILLDMAEWCQMQQYCRECGSEDMDYEECEPAPFHLPFWERKKKTKIHRPKVASYFPLDPRKHPVTILHEYCSMQSIHPSFEFYEIPQKVGIEYGCIATIENFIGEGRAFSKKTAKHHAAVNLLKKLSKPNYYGDNDLGPRRFVSETGIVSVHYESVPKRRSCFKNRPRMTPPPSLLQTKRVQWQDSSDGETEEESVKSSLEELSYKSDDKHIKFPTESQNETVKHDIHLNNPAGIAVDSESDDEHLEREGRFKNCQPAEPRVQKVDITPPNEDQELIDEISEYLSERLRRTSIEQTSDIQVKDEEYSSDEIKVVALNDVTPKMKKKKKKRNYTMMMDGTQTLGRKCCLKEVNPIGYLQEACTFFNCIAPSYNYYREGDSRIKAVCTLLDSSVEVFGETEKDAKRMAAISMIRQLGW